MNKEIMMFGDIEIDNLDVDKMILSNKVSLLNRVLNYLLVTKI